ncbi:hypothetical protein SNA_36135 [Streptomyces natalensis ATCC 27448]|uniref:Uncharacterized protein n=2 Tax=Streptomyces natalensis TaxID=68242 RepID=A0A0D7CEL5_9ACTN|nr:hypothetical protein SNA_36135 [Streptomyces natalensis ATCC 27448]
MWAVMQELAMSAPQALIYFVALLALMLLLALVITLRKTEAEHRPEIIRALADLMSFWRRK